MDQFNKILAVFLLLIVAVGLSLFIFSRLGLLGKIFPSTNIEKPQATNTTSTTPTPPPLVSPSPQVTQTQTGLWGWIARLRAGNPTPTPKAPTTPPPTQENIVAMPSTEVVPIEPDSAPTTQAQPSVQVATPEVTVVPFGSTSPTSYPASGVDSLLIPLVGTALLLGTHLRRLASHK